MICFRKANNLIQNSSFSRIFACKVSRYDAFFNQTKECKWSVPQSFVFILPNYVDIGPNKLLSQCSLANKDNKIALHIISKNFTIATGFIVVVLYAKTDAMSDPKSNSTFAKQITSGQRKSAGLMLIRNMSISLVIIKAFSRNLN